MCEQDCTKHDFFRKLIGFGFYHHDSIISRSNNQVEIAFSNLLVRRVQDVFAIHITYARSADWSHEGDAGNGHCSRRSNQCENIWLVLAIIAKNLRDAVDFVVETFWKQWAKWTVYQTRNQGFFLGSATFTLEKTTRNAASCGIFFLIVNGQREEILPIFH